MYKYLIIGDPHNVPSEKLEVESLIHYACEVARENSVQTIIITGDLHDTHSLVNLEVVWSYYDAFNDNPDIKFVIYPGNHDIVLRDRTKHTLLPYKALTNVRVVESLAHFEDFDIIPYCSEKELLEMVQNAKSSTLLCHHTFQGAKYENGFYDPEGIDLSKMPYEKIISGHIHLSQTVGQCFYVGAPRWMSISDANENKSVWLWDGQADFKAIDTSSVCKKMIRLSVDEKTNLEDIVIKSNTSLILDIVGTPLFVESMSEKFKGKARVIPNIVSNKDFVVKESVGIENALKHYVLNDYSPEFGVEKSALLLEIQNRMKSQ